jgi:hypothetical protein
MPPLPHSVEDKIAPKSEGVDQLALCRALLEIVAHFEETLYSDPQSTQHVRQTAGQQPDDLADPASVRGTVQG